MKKTADTPPLLPDPEVLKKLIHYRMPFGKYRGRCLIDLPEPYVVWFANRGFPPGELGELLAVTHEIKINGLETLLAPLRSHPHESRQD